MVTGLMMNAHLIDTDTCEIDFYLVQTAFVLSEWMVWTWVFHVQHYINSLTCSQSSVSFPIPFPMYFYLNFQTETAYRVRSTVVHIETNISYTNWWKYRLISNPYHECIKIMMMMSLLLILYKTWWYSPKVRENKNRKQFIKNNKQCST